MAITRAKWDPNLHPRGPVGRFIPVSGRPPRVPRGSKLTKEHVQEAESYYSDAQSGAVADYVSGSESLNNSLRGLGEYDTNQYGMPREKMIAELDGAIDRFPIPQPIKVYRGLDDQLDFESMQPGDQIHDRAYLSTTLRGRSAGMYGNNRLEIRLPAGTRVVPTMEDYDDPFLTDDDLEVLEQEVIVGRGSVLQVDSVTRGRYGWEVKAHLVGYLDHPDVDRRGGSR